VFDLCDVVLIGYETSIIPILFQSRLSG